MFFNTKITLIASEKKQDENGYAKKTTTSKNVWACEKSIDRKEFYASKQSGIGITAVYEIRTKSFSEKFTECRVGADVFKILKSYKKKNGVTELTLGEQ